MASGRPELLLPIVSDFETHGREQLSNLHAALTQGRLEDGKSILHQLKGASGTMGMIRFEELCRECEDGDRRPGIEIGRASCRERV